MIIPKGHITKTYFLYLTTNHTSKLSSRQRTITKRKTNYTTIIFISHPTSINKSKNSLLYPFYIDTLHKPYHFTKHIFTHSPLTFHFISRAPQTHYNKTYTHPTPPHPNKPIYNK